MADTGPAQQASREKDHVDDKVAAALDRLVDEGTPRLHRPLSDLLATAAVAGIEVTLGAMALLVVKQQTGNELLAALAFSFGFIALLLGHSELFTEGFLVPITVVAAKRATLRDMVRFWLGAAIGNLVGGYLMAWIVMRAYPQVHTTAIEVAKVPINSGITLRSFCLAVLAGAAITVMTRMQNGTDSDAVRVFASAFTAFLLAGLQLAHSILVSIEIFCALLTNHAPFGYLDWLGWFGWTVLGNVVGGVGLVTLLRLWRSRELLQAHQQAGGPDGDDAHTGSEGSRQPRTA